MATIARGTFRKKIHRHEAHSTSAPPSGGPPRLTAPVPVAQIPIARPLSLPKVERSSERLPVVRRAPAAPWRIRARIRTAALGAIPPRDEASANPAVPAMNILRRPSRSSRAPATRYREASASEYESMIHCCAPKPIPKSVRIAGRATLIAVTEAIDEPRTVATSVRRRQAASESGLLRRKRRSKGCNRPMLSRSRRTAAPRSAGHGSGFTWGQSPPRASGPGATPDVVDRGPASFVPRSDPGIGSGTVERAVGRSRSLPAITSPSHGRSRALKPLVFIRRSRIYGAGSAVPGSSSVRDPST